MRTKNMMVACVMAGLWASASLAQTTAPATPPATTMPAPMVMRPVTPAVTAPSVTAPTVTRPVIPAVTAPAPAPAATRVAPVPTGAKVNLNTAAAAQLDGLPQVGKARTKVIMDERAKGAFKDWADFDKRTQHTSVNAGVKSKIKDLVAF